MRESSGRPVAPWVMMGVVFLSIVVGTTVFFLDTVGLIAVYAVALIAGVVVWMVVLDRMEAMWAIFVASFVLLPFDHVRLTVGTLSVPPSAFFSGLVMAIIGMRFLITRDLKLKDYGILCSLALILFGNTLSLMAAREPELSVWLLLKWFFHALLLIFIMSFRDRVWHLRTLLTLVLVTGALSAYGLVTYLTDDNTYDVNFYAGVGTRSAVGLHLSLVLPLALGLGMVSQLSRLARLSVWSSIGVSVVALGFTYSRGGWLAALAGFVVFGWGRRRVLALSLVGIAILYLGYLGPVDIQERFWSVFSLQEDTRHPDVTNAQRLMLGSQALRVILDHPILGVGLGNYNLHVPRYTIHALERGPHNSYLSVWAEGGLLALVGFLGMYWFVIRRVLRGIGETTSAVGADVLRGALGSLVALLTHLLTIDDFNNIIVWTVMGLSVSASRIWASQVPIDAAEKGQADLEHPFRDRVSPRVDGGLMTARGRRLS